MSVEELVELVKSSETESPNVTAGSSTDRRWPPPDTAPSS